MASKRRKHPRHAAPTRSAAPAELLRAGSDALAAGRYREAVDLFKALAKTDMDRSAWEPGLAAAYRGRALELQAKGMEREALMIWENLGRLLPGRVPDPAYLVLCLRLGRGAAVAEGYRALVRNGADADRAMVQSHLAAALLGGGGPAPDFLGEDDPVLRDAEPARAALEAYCRGDDAAAAENLRRIPFRSPYRDYAAAMKALLLREADPAGAARLLERVGKESAFHPLVSAVRLATLPEAAFLEALPGIGPQSQALAFALRGWSAERDRLWKDLSRFASAPDPLQLVGLLARHRESLGAAWARRKMRALLLTNTPRRLPPAAQREFAGAELDLIDALASEERLDLWTLMSRWRKALTGMRQHSPEAMQPGSDQALRIALLQRRLATDLKLLESPAGAEVEKEVEQSLTLDPDFLPGYLLLVRHFRRTERPKEARRILDLAQGRWPEDAELLNEALDIALDTGAFKKATAIARRLLERDPINRRARQRLFEAHLAHARKQRASGRSDLALRELELAEPWSDGSGGRERVEMLRGILLLDTGAGAPDRLRESCARSAPGVGGWFVLALEAARIGADPRDLLKRIGLNKVPALTLEDLQVFARLLREGADTGADAMANALKPFQPALEKAARLKLGRADYENLCDTLHRVRAYRLQAAFAKAALKRWPRNPLFELHHFQGKRGDPGAARISGSDIDRLEAAMERARIEGDTRTAGRLEKEFRSLYPPPRFDPFDSFNPFEMDDDDFPEGAFDGAPFGGGFDPDQPLSPKQLSDFIETLHDTPEGKGIRELERELGRDAVLGMIEDALNESAGLPPAPPVGRRRRRKRKPAKHARDTKDTKDTPPKADSADDAASSGTGDTQEQLKLF